MVAATQIARRLGAILPLAILALAMLLVVMVVLVMPDRRHREIAEGVMDHLVRFAAVAAGAAPPERLARSRTALSQPPTPTSRTPTPL